jgi:hypothetical protein
MVPLAIGGVDARIKMISADSPDSRRIILTDADADGRASTFADDSFADVHDPLAPGVDLRWHSDVVNRLARKTRELKASLVVNHWNELPRELRAAILRTIREARISIVDPRVYELDFDRMLHKVARGGGREIRALMRHRFLDPYVRERILWDSPAWRIERALFPVEPLGIAEVYGVSRAAMPDSGLFDKLKNKLRKVHTTRLYGARSAAAFAELFDPDERRRALEAIVDRRYFQRSSIDVEVLTRTRSVHHVFDEGNRPSVDAVEILRESADEALRRDNRFLMLPFPSGTVSEDVSRLRPELQAADVAAGYARRLYESVDGLKKVCLEFRQVLLNGRLVRDYRQSG